MAVERDARLPTDARGREPESVGATISLQTTRSLVPLHGLARLGRVKCATRHVRSPDGAFVVLLGGQRQEFSPCRACASEVLLGVTLTAQVVELELAQLRVLLARLVLDVGAVARHLLHIAVTRALELDRAARHLGSQILEHAAKVDRCELGRDHVSTRDESVGEKRPACERRCHDSHHDAHRGGQHVASRKGCAPTG